MLSAVIICMMDFFFFFSLSVCLFIIISLNAFDVALSLMVFLVFICLFVFLNIMNESE